MRKLSIRKGLALLPRVSGKPSSDALAALLRSEGMLSAGPLMRLTSQCGLPSTNITAGEDLLSFVPVVDVHDIVVLAGGEELTFAQQVGYGGIPHPVVANLLRRDEAFVLLVVLVYVELAGAAGLGVDIDGVVLAQDIGEAEVCGAFEDDVVFLDGHRLSVDGEFGHTAFGCVVAQLFREEVDLLVGHVQDKGVGEPAVAEGVLDYLNFEFLVDEEGVDSALYEGEVPGLTEEAAFLLHHYAIWVF